MLRFSKSSSSRWEMGGVSSVAIAMGHDPSIFMQALGCSLSLHPPCRILSLPCIVSACSAGSCCWKPEILLSQLGVGLRASLLTQLVLWSPPRSGCDSPLASWPGYPCPQGHSALPWGLLWWTNCPINQSLSAPSLEHPGTFEHFLYKNGNSRKHNSVPLKA